MIKESYYYEKLDEDLVKCLLCPHYCVLKKDQFGLCKSRKNINGKLISTSYGNLCSIGIDPIEKKPLYHFLPGTQTYSISSAGCNFKCLHCQNDGISQYHPYERNNFFMSPNDVVEQSKINNCKSISYTYTEPTTFYEFMLDTSKISKGSDLKNVMVSNGYINEEPLKELINYIDAFNIDLKYFSNEIYKNMSGARLDPVLKTLEIIRDSGKWLEITNLVIPDINDDLELMEEMYKWLFENNFKNFPIHISRFYPRYKMADKNWTTMEDMFKSFNIAKKTGMSYVYLGNVPDEYMGDVSCLNCSKPVIIRENYKILENHLNENFKCEYCDSMVDGVFI